MRSLHEARSSVDRAGAAVDARALGVDVRLVVTDPQVLGEAVVELDTALDELDRACSRFRDDSEVVRLDRAGGRATVVSPTLVGALAAAVRAARLTDGDVDPTIGHALEAAGYDRDFSLVAAAGPPLRLRPQPAPGWRAIELDAERQRVRVPAGLLLDLGATAKAWAADCVAESAARRLGCGVLVSLGGDVAVAGREPPGGWVVGVHERSSHPEKEGADGDGAGEPVCVTVRTGGLATSSTTARRWVRGRRVLHHILDPGTGLPAGGTWRTVSVAAASCLDANAASTAAIVRGASAAPWLQRLGLPARLVDAAGGVTVVAGWPEEFAA